MYVDASDSCNQLNFQLGPNGMGTAVATRTWNLKVNEPDEALKNCKFTRKIKFHSKIWLYTKYFQKFQKY